MAAILKNRYDVITPPPIAKLGMLMQNDMPITTDISKSIPAVDCQYGGRPFSETGSSFIILPWIETFHRNLARK